MFIHILWFVVGLIALIRGGDWFVDGATGIAKKFNIPDLLIGATVVSIGTTLPEVMVSATSAAQGYGAMAYGNAIGSIICNTALIAALTIAIRPAAIRKEDMVTPVIFFFIAAAFYAGTAYITGNFTRLTGVILLCMFVIYMFVVIRQALKERSLSPADVNMTVSPADKAAETAFTKEAEPQEASAQPAATPVRRYVLDLIVGAICIAVGSKLLVEHGVEIAEAMGVPQTVIALTFVALGTSLPELVTAITSLVKGHGALSVGNICGANLFNLVLVSGISIVIGPFSFAKPDFATLVLFEKEYFSSLIIDTPLMILVMVIMTIPALITGKLKRWQGILLLCIYAAFCIYQFCG